MDEFEAVVVIDEFQDIIYHAKRGGRITIIKGPNAKIHIDDLKYVK